MTKQLQTTQSNKKNRDTQPSLINMTHIFLKKKHVNTLELGSSYVLERHPKQYINELIIDTENTIRQLDPKIQSLFQYLAAKKIKEILA